MFNIMVKSLFFGGKMRTNYIRLLFLTLPLFVFADKPLGVVDSSDDGNQSSQSGSAQAETRSVSVSTYDTSSSVGDSYGIEEVVVTASKREESLQETPIAVTAITESTIEDLNIRSLEDIQQMSPNVHIIRAPANNTATTIAIRGNSTMNPAITWENAVALYVDGVYIGKTQGSLFDMVDLERVEMLRGPQGTLYGRNALAGAINFITKKPSGAGGQAKVTVGNYGLFSRQLSYDIGWTDQFFTKLTYLRKDRGGYVQNNPSPLTPAQGVVGSNPIQVDELDTIDLKATRIQFSYQGDSVSWDLVRDTSDQDNTPPYAQLTRLLPNWSTLFGVNAVPGVPGVELWPLERFVNPNRSENASTDAPVSERSDIVGTSFTISFDTSLGEVKAIYGERELDWWDYLDLDGSPFPIFHTNRDTDYESKSYELQLVGATDNINYVFGYFKFEDEAFTDNPQYPFALDNPEGQQYSGDTDADAYYAQIDFKLTDRTTITAGIRETEETKSGYKTYAAFGVSASSGADFDNTSSTFIVNHELSDSTNVYVKFAEGFKGGGYNAEEAVDFATFSLVNGFNPYGPETVESTELGLKGVYFDNKFSLNAAYFMNEHDDMQVAYFNAQGAVASEVLNASAEIDGLELEMTAYLSDVSRLSVNYGWLDIGGYTGRNIAADGFALEAFPYSPEHTWFLTYERDFSNWTLRLDHESMSDHYAFPYNSMDPRYEHSFHKGRNVTNARVIMAPSDNFDLVFWVKNLRDEEYSYTNIPFGPPFGMLNVTYFAPGRTVGVDIRYQF